MRRAKAIVRDLPVVGSVLVGAYRRLWPPARRERTLWEPVGLKAVRRKLGRHDGVQVVGPWPGDLETELLYWIPYLRLLVERCVLEPHRTLALAPPEKSVLYAGVAGDCREVSDTATQLGGDVVEALVHPYREGRAGTILPMRSGVYRRIASSVAAGEAVVGEWSGQTALSLFAGTRTIVVEPDDPVRRRDVALAERVAQQIGTPFAVVQPGAVAYVTRLTRSTSVGRNETSGPN